MTAQEISFQGKWLNLTKAADFFVASDLYRSHPPPLLCGSLRSRQHCNHGALEFSRETVPMVPLGHTHTQEHVSWNAFSVYKYRKQVFVIRNWLTWLWRRRNPKSCSWQGGDPGEAMVALQLQSKSRALRTGEPTVSSVV